MAAPVRVRWAVDVLDLRPDDRVLEVGGGTAASARLVLDRIPSGRLVALDRSVTASRRIAAALPREVDGGRLVVVTRALAEVFAGLGVDVDVDADAGDATLSPASVDVAFAVDVNVFWTSDAAPELAVLRRLLVPGGRLVVCFGADGPRAEAVRPRVLEPVARHVSAAGFVDVEVRAETDGVGVLACAPSGSRG
ncbi:MAG TPA: methyltransferase domain-containing protein [Ornithinibacter sp.]|nr:methyltransferase domain-containing protein [Ornithinibacter sp.]